METKKKYVYFVSYSHSDDNVSGFGNSEVMCDFEVKGVADVVNLSKPIAKELNKNIVILYFQLLRIEK